MNPDLDHIHLGLMALTWMAATVVLVYSVVGNRISRWRRPLYYVAIPVALGFTYLYGATFIQQEWGVWPFNYRPNSGLLIRVLLFLLSLLFFLVPYVDRLEHRTAKGVGVIEHKAHQEEVQLQADHAAVMGEQRRVMADQDIVMDEQRQVMEDQRGGEKDDG